MLEYNSPFAACGSYPCVGSPANLVFGQGGVFTTKTCSDGLGADPAPSATGLCMPQSVAVDSAGHLYIADSANNRVLEFDTPLSSQTANRVFGQGANFGTNICSDGRSFRPAPTADGLCNPFGVAVDGANRLYIADTLNDRVLEFDTPLSSQTAIRVFGQGANFTTRTCSDGLFGPAPSADGLCNPFGVAVDSAGRLYIADQNNNRVLEFDTPLSSQTANRVFGQGANFATNICGDGTNGNPAPSADGLCSPMGVATDTANRLYIADTVNNRVFAFETPLASQSADRVLGQNDFLHSALNNLDGTGVRWGRSSLRRRRDQQPGAGLPERRVVHQRGGG